jgi:TPR repeat protein
VQHLRDLARAGSPKAPWAARLRYAYAAALEADGQQTEAEEWYRRAAEVDAAGETDAAEILGGNDEPELIDLDDLVGEESSSDIDTVDQEPKGQADGRHDEGRRGGRGR